MANYYLIVLNDSLWYGGGTSFSSPVVAGMVALINAARATIGLPSMGFLNPFLYQKYASFVIDITEGANNCTWTPGVCCAQGFYASTGW